MNMMSPWHPCSLRACTYSWGTGRLVPSVSDGHLIMDTLLRLCGHLTPSWTTQRTPLESLLDCIPNLSLAGLWCVVSRHHRWTARVLSIPWLASALRRACIGADAPPPCVAWKNQSQCHGELVGYRRGKYITKWALGVAARVSDGIIARHITIFLYQIPHSQTC
jgi:hypothetical protein